MKQLSLKSVYLLENMLNTYLSGSNERINNLNLDCEEFPFLPTAESVKGEEFRKVEATFLKL